MMCFVCWLRMQGRTVVPISCTHNMPPPVLPCHQPPLRCVLPSLQAEAEELRAELERMRTSLDGLKAAQNEYVQSAKKVQRAERKLADRQAGKVGGGKPVWQGRRAGRCGMATLLDCKAQQGCWS